MALRPNLLVTVYINTLYIYLVMSSQIVLVYLGLDGGGVEVADGAAVPLLVVLVEVQRSVPQRAAAGVL